MTSETVTTEVKRRSKKTKPTTGVVASPDPEEATVLAQEQAASPDNSDDEPASESHGKKRKRDKTQASELEIDVNLPEPQSKKALRKAKKQRTQPAEAGKTDGDDTTTSTTATTAATPTSSASSSSKDCAHGIWIGNLAFAITKPMLTTFFTSNASIPSSAITRVHMPAPVPSAASARASIKPVNKGFAYVDFANPQALAAALALSETPFGGRNVLIKDAKSFAGRPDKHVADTAKDGNGATASAKPQKKVSRRIFVGNLGFDVTKDDLQKHFEPCGEVADIHTATFEDSGKCKGFGWVTFAEPDAAEAAVRGWTRIKEDGDGEDVEEEGEDDEEDGAKTKSGGKVKTRKWFVNRLQGRQLRCEFAEDASVRYKKRYGKEAGKEEIADGAEEGREGAGRGGGKRPRDGKFGGNKRSSEALKKHADKAYGGDADDSRYRTGGIVAAEGKKVTFD